MSRRDDQLVQEDLDWLYSGDGCKVFGPSPMGRQLEEARLFSCGSEPCWQCNVDGGGFSPGVMDDGSWCQECNGTGYTETPKVGPEHGEVTARPLSPNGTKSSNREEEHDGKVTFKFAVLSRAVRRVEVERPKLAQALEAYHGPRGVRWGAAAWGAYIPVVAITHEGAKVIAAEQKRGQKGSCDEIIWNWSERTLKDAKETKDREHVIAAAKAVMIAAWDAFKEALG